MILKRKKIKVIEVKWIDTVSSMEEFSFEELIEYTPTTSYSMGYLFYEHKDYIVIAFMVHNNYQVKHFESIPRECIKEIKILQKGVSIFNAYGEEMLKSGKY